MEEHEDPSPTPPYGEYYLRPGRILGTAALLIVPAVLMALWFATSIDVDSAKLRIVANVFIGAVLAPPCIAGLSLVGRLRGGPLLTISEDGIELTSGFLWTLIPLLPLPEKRTLIPWAEIQAIEPIRGLETAVVIQKRGDRKRWWERIGVSAKRPPGRAINLSLLKGRPRDLQRALVDWGEERLRQEIHRARTESLEPGTGGDPDGPETPPGDPALG